MKLLSIILNIWAIKGYATDACELNSKCDNVGHNDLDKQVSDKA